MKVSDYIVRFLEAQGIEYVFGYQGGMVTHLVDSLSRSTKVQFIPCYHEQNAAFAAEGYARMSGKFGVCLVTSGPGATNTLTSVGNAYYDSIPVLYITGQVNTYEYKYDKQIRQLGFQETDIVSVAKPIAKDAFLADDSSQIDAYLKRAVQTMLSGRKGPVVLDLPMNVQRAEIPEKAPERVLRKDDTELPQVKIDEVRDALASSKHPLVLCGGGLAAENLNEAARVFLRTSGLPYAVSLMGKGLVDETDSHCLGMIGSYGNRAANLALSESDVVLVLGSRLDLRQTGNRKSPVLAGIRFIRVDVDMHELKDNLLPNQVCYQGSALSLLQGLEGSRFDISEEWMNRLHEIRELYSQAKDIARHVENKVPYQVMDEIGANAADNAVFVADVGQNQMWAAQVLRPNARQRFLTSGGMAPMGYAISAAVGAAFATGGKRQIVCICGDGGFHLGLQALQLISQYRLPVSVVVLNNRSLGMITQFQHLYFKSNLAGTTAQGGYVVPDIATLAKAYGLDFTDHLQSGAVWEVDTHGLTTVVPKLEYNRGLNDMTPSFET